MGTSSTLKSSFGLQTSTKTCHNKSKKENETLTTNSTGRLHKRLPTRRLPLSKRRPRIVRFDLDANQVMETERIPPESKESLFWTTLEREGIQETNQRLALQFLRQQPLSAAKASLVFDQCCQDHAMDDSSSSEEEEGEPLYGTDDDNDGPADLSTTDAAHPVHDDEDGLQDTLDVTASNLAIDIPAHVRGLEWGFLPASKQYRHTHVQRVLRWQRCLGPSQSKLLSYRVTRSSQPSRTLARILGACDEINAKETPVIQRNRCRMLPSWW